MAAGGLFESEIGSLRRRCEAWIAPLYLTKKTQVPAIYPIHQDAKNRNCLASIFPIKGLLFRFASALLAEIRDNREIERSCRTAGTR